MVAVGESIPDVQLKDSEGKDVSLRSLLGSDGTLVYFYPADWSPVCTSQLTGMCSGIDQFRSLGMKIIGISADHQFSHQAFGQKIGAGGLEQEIVLTSGSRPVFEQFGVALPNGFANRAYVVVDKQGTVRFMKTMNTPPESIDNTELLTIIRSLKEKMRF